MLESASRSQERSPTLETILRTRFLEGMYQGSKIVVEEFAKLKILARDLSTKPGSFEDEHGCKFLSQHYSFITEIEVARRVLG